MPLPPDHNKLPFDRRRFIGNTIKLVAFAGIVSPLEQACKSKSSQQNTTIIDTATKKTKPSTHVAKHTTRRHKWNQEKLVINTKTNVAHLPTAAFYNYYDEIKHTRDVNIGSWENQVQGEVRLNKDKSGNILEILSLQKLKKWEN